MRLETSPARLATVALFGARAVYGLALVAAPKRVAGGRWLGPGAAAAPAQVAIRGIGAREIALHAAGIVATLAGAPVAPWLLTSMAGDVADIASTFAGRDGLPEGSAPATLAVAGISAALSAMALATGRTS